MKGDSCMCGCALLSFADMEISGSFCGKCYDAADQSSPDPDIPIQSTGIVRSSKRVVQKPLRVGWTSKEDKQLRKAVLQFKARSWKKIASFVSGRTDVQCLHRWQKVLNPNLVKGYWTKEEDERLKELVDLFGTKRWAAIARCLPGRIGKQCRERWCNHLDPKIKKVAWSSEEEATLLASHRIHGNKWAAIAKLLPGRSENAVKNHWNSTFRRAQRVTNPKPDSGKLSLNDSATTMSSGAALEAHMFSHPHEFQQEEDGLMMEPDIEDYIAQQNFWTTEDGSALNI